MSPKPDGAKEPLIVVVGAGASVAAGIPNTARLGEVTKRALPMLHLPGVAYGTKPFRIDRSVPMADVLDSALRGQYENYDFEILLHALEQLEPFAAREYVISQGANTPVLGAFAEMMRRYEPLSDQNVIREARQAAIQAIHREVGSASIPYIVQPKQIQARGQLSRIFKSLASKCRLIVIVFNYDDLLDQIDIEWHDGFTDPVPDRHCQIFSPTAWSMSIEDPAAHLLMHVHGSVRFGIKPFEALSSTTAFSEPAKFDTVHAAMESVSNSTVSGTSVDGQVYDAGVIISGLGKAGKIAYNARPYGYYQRAISQILPFASHLLVMGYGWRDEHINTWIDEMVDLQPNRRSAVVTWRTGKDVGDNQSLEYRHLTALAGAGWQTVESSAFVRREDPNHPKVLTSGNFMIAPGGFVLDDSVEKSILDFLLA